MKTKKGRHSQSEVKYFDDVKWKSSVAYHFVTITVIQEGRMF